MSSHSIALRLQCWDSRHPAATSVWTDIQLHLETSDSQRTAMSAGKCEPHLLGDRDDKVFFSVWTVDILLSQ